MQQYQQQPGYPQQQPGYPQQQPGYPQQPGMAVSYPQAPQYPPSVPMMHYAPAPQLMDDLEEYVPLPTKIYDVTNKVEQLCGFIWCPCMGCNTQKLLLDDQEVMLKTRNLLFSNTQRRPYAQLGTVDMITQACGCYALVSDFAPVNENGEGGISPGWGCDGEKVTELVRELQDRQRKRGGIAQVRRLEYLFNKIVHVAQQLPQLHKELGIDYTPKVPAIVEGATVFPTKQLDVSSCLEPFLGCSQTLLLDAEEMTYTREDWCTTFSRKKEYSQIDNVWMAKSCFCYRMALADEMLFSPGWGCQGQKVGQIVDEIRTRVFARGAIGQIKKQERMLKQIVEISEEIALVERQLGIPASSAVKASTLEEDVQQVSTKEYDVTDSCAACMGCLCTCGLAGCTSTKVSLQDDYMMMTEKNNCGVMDLKQPYGNMGAVDHDKTCCCCHSVNGMSPGWGCQSALVHELSQELQARKVKRGNIAQLKQLLKMQGATTEMDMKADAMLAKQGVQYPPTQEVMTRVFGPHPPRVLTKPPQAPHMEANKEFDVKEYDVTNYCSRACTCLGTLGLAGPCDTRTMRLEKEELFIYDSNWCGTSNYRQPYAQIESVDIEKVCCGMCTEVPGVANPGCGCSNQLVAELVHELQERKEKRGMIAQLKTQENVMNEVLKLGVKVDLLLDHFTSLKRI